MRIPCPTCGDRDIREFYYQGAAVALQRPAPDAAAADWHDYVHLRDNLPGPHEELWSHDAGCGAWLVVTRDTATHEVSRAQMASEVAR